MSTKISASLVEAILDPWAARSDWYDLPRYELARRDEPSMRNLIRAELMPRIGRWDAETTERLQIALALALRGPRLDRMLEAHHTPVAFPEYDDRYFWLWVWDELFNEDLPDATEFNDYELDWSPGGLPEISVSPGSEVSDRLDVYEARKVVRYRLDQ